MIRGEIAVVTSGANTKPKMWIQAGVSCGSSHDPQSAQSREDGLFAQKYFGSGSQWRIVVHE